jgi:hypothetical protein
MRLRKSSEKRSQRRSCNRGGAGAGPQLLGTAAAAAAPPAPEQHQRHQHPSSTSASTSRTASVLPCACHQAWLHGKHLPLVTAVSCHSSVMSQQCHSLSQQCHVTAVSQLVTAVSCHSSVTACHSSVMQSVSPCPPPLQHHHPLTLTMGTNTKRGSSRPTQRSRRPKRAISGWSLQRSRQCGAAWWLYTAVAMLPRAGPAWDGSGVEQQSSYIAQHCSGGCGTAGCSRAPICQLAGAVVGPLAVAGAECNAHLHRVRLEAKQLQQPQIVPAGRGRGEAMPR